MVPNRNIPDDQASIQQSKCQELVCYYYLVVIAEQVSKYSYKSDI